MRGFNVRLRDIAAASAFVVLSACSGSMEVATSSPTADSKAPSPSPIAAPSPSPDSTPSPDPSPSPFVFPSPTPLPIGTPVTRHVLAPAKELPVVALCSYRVITTADGNYRPLFCRSGAINVVAWKGYVLIGPHVMSLSRSSPLLEVERAMCLDSKYLHATKPEAYYAYEISAAYHGWKFEADISKWQDQPYDPKNVLC